MKLVIARGNHGDYVIYRGKCTCMAGTFGLDCKHLREARRLGMVEEFESVAKSLKTFPSFLSGVNEMVGGPLYTSEVIVAVHGKPGVGKTLFALHETAHLLSRGVNVLYIDTEGGFKNQVMSWWGRLSERFKLSGEKRGKAYLESRKTLSSLHEFLGYKTKVVTVKEKTEFRIEETVERPEVDKVIEELKIGFVILDSVSMPVATAINEEQQNRPARFTATALIMGKLAELQEKYHVGVLTIHHSSWNPANPYATFAQMRGGKIVHHFSKRVLYIDVSGKSALKNYRQIWLMRGEDEPRLGDVAFCLITGEGIKDVDIKTGYEKGLLTDSELENLRDNPRWDFVRRRDKK